ncbi:unnamed protein product [Victoria cruziana]
MAGKHVLFSNPRNPPSSTIWVRPSTLIFSLTVAILILSTLLFYSYTHQQNPSFVITNSFSRYTVPKYSFIAFLEEFLKTRASLLGPERELVESAVAGSLKIRDNPVFDE